MKSLWLLLLRLLLGGVFVAAGFVKIIDPAGFAVDVANYRLLPHATVNLVAITLPWVELIAGGFLMFGKWPRASAALIALMMAVFIVAIASAVLRGLDVRCGCFGTVEGRKIGVTTFLQDGALFLMALWVWWRSEKQ
jgi:uncharacterized membrane protein YphA (DoxX/SURF4 family)